MSFVKREYSPRQTVITSENLNDIQDELIRLEQDKYAKPEGGIPKTDLAAEVKTSLGKADTALQEHQPLTDYRTAAAQDEIDQAQDTEINDLHESKAPVIINSASGAIANFTDGAENMPVRKLVANIDPVQAAGTPSPENPLPISGWTGAEIEQRGKNIVDVLNDPLKPDKGWSSSGNGSSALRYSSIENAYYTTTSRQLNYIFKPEGTCTVSFYAKRRATSGNATRSGFDGVQTNRFPPLVDGYTDEFKRYTATYTVKSGNRFFLILYGGIYIKDLQIEFGSATDYEPYTVNPISVTFPAEAGTVYGGTLTINEDGSGELRTRPEHYSYNGETLVGPWLSSMDVYADGATPTIGAQVVDLGGEETVYQLTDQQAIDTLYGTNNIWADCGDVEVTYRADTKLYIDNKIAEAIAAALNA